MMMKKTESPSRWLKLAAVVLVLSPFTPLRAQGSTAASGAGNSPAAAPANAATTATAGTAQAPNRAVAYYHLALAATYEDDALSDGHQEDVTHAVEEYKLALDADPNSAELANALADLYFRTGSVRQAEAAARALLKIAPDNVEAHKLLGRIYLRQLGEAQNGVSSSSPSGNVLDQAIGEFEKIVELQPKNVEDRMVLGQLYTVKHQPEKAEAEFKSAQAIEPESEDVVLNLARLYAESGDLQKSVQVIVAVPESDRTPKMEFTLGAAYEQLKQPKNAIAAYGRAEDMEPGDLRTMDALARALFNNNQYDDALKQYKQLAAADPENNQPLIRISEIQRRQGKYEDALNTIQKAMTIDPSSLEAGYNEGLLLDVLGRFDEAAQTYQKMVDLTSHANGAYTDEEKNNRSIFLERLGAVNLEQNKIDQAIAAYQKIIDMGGDNAVRGYQGEVDAYQTAKQFDKAVEVSQKAVASNPKNRDLKLMLAGELADQGKPDDALAMAKGLLNGSADNDRTVWFAVGQIDIRLKRWKDAEDAFAKAEPLATKKDDRIYLLFLRGELADREKHMDQAEQYFHQALALDPTNAMTLNYLGYMLADKGIRLPEALKFIRQAVDIEPMNGAYLDSLGWVYFKLGQYELAEDNLRQAVQRDQTDPTVHEHLGDLYEKTGRIRLAAAQWQLSLAEFAKSSPADVDPGDVTKVQRKLESARVRLAREESIIGPSKPE
ncbi:MAG TPA: tetratricopeptide repeat protein [Terracidiphilus sp.]|jgi:tetratricopeptide (TPR) repeat protein|nr:tetratricopeptide repeat protein [Terracidiphilus sp.]